MSSISNRNMMSGLISGLDTESLVKAMTANTKNRINSQKQKLQTLTWKQESYRDVISKITDFKNKYLDTLADTSIKANKVMKSYSATSSNDKVISATAAAGAAEAKYTIKSATAAKTASVSSGGSVSTGEVRLDFSKAVSGRNYNVEMTLDGVTKTVSFRAGANAEASKTSFLNAVNAVFAEVKGSDKQFEFTEGTSDLKFNSGDDVFHTFSVGYNQEGVGLGNTTSNKIYTSSTINSVGFKQALQKSDDGTYAFNINGVDFEFADDVSISHIVSTVNNSNAGVKLSFSNVSQSFTIESAETGDGAEVNIYQTKGNLLNAMFNLPEGQLGLSTADTAKLTYIDHVEATGKLSSAITDNFKTGFEDGEGKYSVKVTLDDGVTHTLELDIGKDLKQSNSLPDTGYTDEQVTLAFENAFRQAYVSEFGSSSGLPSDNVFGYSGGNLTINTVDATIEFENNFTKGDTALTNTKEMNASPAYVPERGVKEMKFTRNGEEVVVTGKNGADVSLQDLIEAKIIALPSDGRVIAAGDIEGANENGAMFLMDVFGKESVKGAKDSDIISAYGSNGIIEISSDGETFTKYSSASNLFVFDGTTIDISSSKEFKAESEEDYITVETGRNTEGIKDVVVNFVNDYNKLLEDLYKVVNTNRPKSSGSYYDPLTEEQEEEMSDKEIEKWNENAKQGLLYRDSNVSKFLSEIREAMVTRVNGFGLSSIGVTLTDDWEDNGKLKIDESKLESAINAYGDQVADLFTNTENGLAAKLEFVIDKAVSTSTATTKDASGKTIKKGYGYLSQMAGIEGTKTDKDNLIYKQMEYINDVIERLTERYETEQERYWSKYTTLEKMMSQMQTTLSYFEQ
ncbi:MAG: flagellar filament capping protein FliD [Ruminococcus sp.]|nr:flagellar filament capping protein FliD [Ruminococcus sp.]MCM1380659.1 flagellar filament capping protein FliD [Muribaculaceae bacterium]